MDKKIVAMSKIGYPCERYLWHNVNKIMTKKYDDAFDARAAEAGDAYEILAMEWLKRDGWQVEPCKDFYEIELDNCVLRGRPGCFIAKGVRQNVLADIKSMNEAEFVKFKQLGARIFKPQFVSQLSVYTRGAVKAGRAVNWMAIVAVNRNTNDYWVEFVKFDPYENKQLLDKAARIASEMPPHGIPSWLCNYCYAECKADCPIEKIKHEAEQENNFSLNFEQLEDKSVEPENAELDDAIRRLREARKKISEWKAREDEAKDAIDRLALKYNAKIIYSGNLILMLNEINSMRFDVKSFKQEHPEFLSEYMKPQTALVYKVKETGRDGE